MSFARSDHNRFTHREALFALVQDRASTMDYAEIAQALGEAGATFERYRTMHEASTDPELVADNPLFGPSPANPSGFAYPAPGPIANMPAQDRGAPAAAPYNGQHSEEVLAERLGLSSGQIGALVDAGTVGLSDRKPT